MLGRRVFENPHIFEMLGVFTNTDVSGDATDIEIGDLFLSDQLLHVGLAQLLVVKEGRIGINVRVETLLDNVAIRVDLDKKDICM